MLETERWWWNAKSTIPIALNLLIVQPYMYGPIQHLVEINARLKGAKIGMVMIAKLQGKFSQKIKIKLLASSEIWANMYV